FAGAIPAMRCHADLLPRLAARTQAAGLAALSAGDIARASTALEFVLPALDPNKAVDVWDEVVTKIANPAELSWEVRRFLLPRVARSRSASGQDTHEQIVPWFHVETEHLAEALTLELPA